MKVGVLSDPDPALIGSGLALPDPLQNQSFSRFSLWSSSVCVCVCVCVCSFILTLTKCLSSLLVLSLCLSSPSLFLSLSHIMSSVSFSNPLSPLSLSVLFSVPLSLHRFTYLSEYLNQREFYREVQILKKFRHRHLISLFAICTSSEPYYIITEYMEKGDLLDFLRGKLVSTLAQWFCWSAGLPQR